MTAQNYTAEPWEVITNCPGECCWHIQQVGNDNLMDTINNPEMSQADARRIVACVNACADIEDPANYIASMRKELDLANHRVLTCGVAATHPDANLSRREKDYGGKWDSPQAESVRRVREQRDELLTSFKEVLRISDRKHDAWDAAKAAIAKVETKS